MTQAALFLTALALAMDAFAVALTTGIQLGRISAGQTVRMAGAFGAFQFLMPVLGWFFGARLQEYVHAWDHWIAFALLAFIGVRMIREAWKADDGETADNGAPAADPTKGRTVVLLGIATSIDALAVGFSMALMGQDIWLPAAVIGVVCFCLTACGMHIGRIMRHVAGSWGNKSAALGGFVLIAIGVNILREHGIFS